MELALLILGIGALIWWLGVRPADCVIRRRNGSTEVRGRLPAGPRQQIEQLLETELSDVRSLRVAIRYARGPRPIQIRIRGKVSAGQRQMIRNFLLTEL